MNTSPGTMRTCSLALAFAHGPQFPTGSCGWNRTSQPVYQVGCSPEPTGTKKPGAQRPRPHAPATEAIQRGANLKRPQPHAVAPCADYRSRSRACNLKYCAFVCRAPPQLSVALNAFRSRQWKQTCHFRHGQGERHPHGYSTSFRASLVCCPEIFLNIIHHRQRPFLPLGKYGRWQGEAVM